VASKIVLAYSGGLDTSVAIHWIKERYGYDVITLTVDIGNKPDLEAIREKAIKIGAIKAYIADGRDDFVKYFVWPALQAGAIYEKEYLLATGPDRGGGPLRSDDAGNPRSGVSGVSPSVG
jgi:argininosuccinate synthase